MGVQGLKHLLFGTQCFMVPFLGNLVLVLALTILEMSLSLIFGFHFSNLLQFVVINKGARKIPPLQFVSNHMDI